MSRVVFVGNVPYDMGEEQLIEAFKEVGTVIGFRLVYDRDTGKPKGYGFCEFSDNDTALSAVRNLNGQDVGGRPLRIDLADSDPFLEGKTTVRGELLDATETRAQWRERERHRFRSDPFLASLPSGVPVPPGQNALDQISRVLAGVQPSEVLEVLAQMKAFIITHPDQARALLVAHPQLGYALFQALLLNKIVDPSVLERMLAATGASSSLPPSGPPTAPAAQAQAPAPYHAPPPGMQHPQQGYGAPPGPAMGQHAQMYPPQPMPPSGPSYFRPPPPANAPVAPAVSAPAPVPTPTPAAVPPTGPSGAAPPAALAGMDPAQRDMLMQVLSLTPDQINSLPPTEREQIYQLRKSLGMPPT